MKERSLWKEEKRIPDWEGNMGVLFGAALNGVRYPMYMYPGDSNQSYEDMEERGSNGVMLVNNTDEELAARKRGYDNIHAGMIANKVLINWYWDLEDFSPKQLVYFAQEEFGVDLPIEAHQLKLLDAVLRLTKAAPQNCNRIVLMAHTIKLNYDETLSSIRKMIEGVPEEIVQEFTA